MGLEPPYLADRKGQLERFQLYLDGFPEFPRNLRLTGLRGVGKTVLLRRYATLAESQGWLVIRREWSEHLLDERTFSLALVEDCQQAADRSSTSTHLKHRASAVIKQAVDLIGSITVSVADVAVGVKPHLGQRTGPATLEDHLFQAFRSAAEAAGAAGRRGIVLCYDEAHVVRDTTRTRQYPLSSLLSTIARAQLESMSLMLIVCGLPTLTENLARAKSYSERMFQSEGLDRLRPPEDLHAFTRPLTAAHRVWEPGVAEAVVRDTVGYPYFIQFVGAQLWEASDWAAPVRVGNYERIRPAIFKAIDHAFFDARLARTSRLERRLLHAIARDGETASIGSALRRLGISNGAVQWAALRLIEKGLLYRPERGTVAFTLPLFGDYLRRQARLEAS
jgi:hypothetical protein